MEINPLAENNPDRPQRGWFWWLLGGAGLLGICCLPFLVVLVLTAALGSPLTGSYTFKQYYWSSLTPLPDLAGSTPLAPDSTPSIAVLSPAPFDYPNPKENSIGDPNAPITIVEFGDFQCPYCAGFWSDTEKSLIKNYVASGKVYFTYRSIEFVGPESQRAAEAAYCAADQGKFWPYHDFLFANQAQENSGTFAENNLLAFARAMGLDQAQFTACLSSRKYRQRVAQDGNAAARAGVLGTPAFLIDGRLLEGAQSYQALSHFCRRR